MNDTKPGATPESADRSLMPIVSVAANEHAGTGNFEVRTVAVDATRAAVRVTGDLRAECGLLLAEVLDGHLRAGRRFVRLNVSGIDALDPAAGAELQRAHRAFLERRGTLILTGVGTAVRAALAAGGLLDDLLVLPPSAAEPLLAAGF
jgi:anti-anti-sigma regulatory factor